MKKKEDDIDAALSGIFSKDLIEKIKSFKRTRVGEINQEFLNELGSILEQAANEKSEFIDNLTPFIDRDIFGAMSHILKDPYDKNARAQFEKFFNSKKTKDLWKLLLPKQHYEKLINSPSLLDFLVNFTEIGRNAFNGVTEDYSDYTKECRVAMDNLQNDLLSDIEKIKTRIEYVKKIENFRDIISIASAVDEIYSELLELRDWKDNVNIKYIKETVLPIYFDLAAKYEMISKFVLIDIEICEGRFDPKLEYMEFSLGCIVNRISRSSKFSIFADVEPIIRNSLAHGGKYSPLENKKTIRFFDLDKHLDLTYAEIIDKTCRLSSLFYVVLGYLLEGYKKEFQMLKDNLDKKRA